MNREQIEKLIWEISAKTKISDIPNKEKTWNNLTHLMEDSKIPIKANKISSMQYIKNLWTNWNYNYAIILTLTAILTLPLFYKSYQNNTYKTKLGENLSLVLPDNSKVTLHSESTIEYKKIFNTNHRILHLEGEAYFEVTNLASPFIVKTQYGDVTVLGTTFNVRSRTDEFEVGVNTGKVKVSNQESSLQLDAKQCIMDKSNFNKKNIVNIPSEKYPGWINQKIHCNNTDLELICKEIERIYNIKIKFSDQSMKKITITGIIDTSELENMLNTISLLTQRTFKLEGGAYTII